jgi:hypothetical protein
MAFVVLFRLVISRVVVCVFRLLDLNSTAPLAVFYCFIIYFSTLHNFLYSNMCKCSKFYEPTSGYSRLRNGIPLNISMRNIPLQTMKLRKTRNCIKLRT